MRAYRLPEKTILEIERLSEEWECTHAEVIERAISEIDSTPDRTEQILRQVEDGLRADPEIMKATEGRIYRTPPNASTQTFKRGPRPKGDPRR